MHIQMRNNAIDCFRAISIILVTLFHLGATFGGPGMDKDGFSLGNIFGNGWVGVGMFFVISGFCMGASTERKFSGGFSGRVYARYVINRFLRIAPSYYASIAFWYFVITQYEVVVKPVDPFDILTHLLYIHNFFQETMHSISGVYWTLAAEMQFYILLPFIFALLSSILGKALIFLLSLAMAVAVSVSSDNIILTFGLPAYLCLFVAGVLSYMHRVLIHSILSLYGIVWLIAIAMFIILCSEFGVYDNKARIYEIIFSCLFSLVLAYFSVKESRATGDNLFIGFLAFIGRCSFSIYLYNYIMRALPVENSGFINFIFLILSAFIVGIIAHIVIERPSEKARKHFMRSKGLPVTNQI
ncbi:acyltransferase [Pantoea agglomerans]|uniref:acyltransferase family protein n=1 Tax=Enterobacter agglomerans TaxID=549 RepID=UPI003207CA51